MSDIVERLRLFLPAYNAMPGLVPTLRSLLDLAVVLESRGRRLSVLVINDASTDGTARELNAFMQIANAARPNSDPLATVVHREQNVGNAAGIVEGYKWAIDRAKIWDYVGCCDADGEHNPLSFVRHLDDFNQFDGVIGSIIYPPHNANWNDLNTMRSLGGLQASLAGADQPFYIQSPGWNLYRANNFAHVLWHLDAYRGYCAERLGSFPRWGMHSVVQRLAGATGLRLHSAYLECFGQAPNRTAEKLMAQAEANLTHMKILGGYIAENIPATN